MFRTILFLLLAVFLAAAHAMERPNIVVFLSDDHSLRDCSVHGAKDIATPNMQRLAEAGMTFENAFVVAALITYTNTHNHTTLIGTGRSKRFEIVSRRAGRERCADSGGRHAVVHDRLDEQIQR